MTVNSKNTPNVKWERAVSFPVSENLFLTASLKYFQGIVNKCLHSFLIVLTHGARRMAGRGSSEKREIKAHDSSDYIHRLLENCPQQYEKPLGHVTWQFGPKEDSGFHHILTSALQWRVVQRSE